MKRSIPPYVAAVGAAFCSALLPACSGPSNNTQRGAAGGAAVGAIAGAIIGNNRGSGNAASGAAIGAAAGAIAGGALGRRRDVADQRDGGTYSTTAAPYVTPTGPAIVIQGAPPLPPAPMIETVPPQPSSSAVWIPGYWSYENGQSYVWVSGRWEIPPQGYRAFQPPYWVQQGTTYTYVRGGWRQ